MQSFHMWKYLHTEHSLTSEGGSRGTLEFKIAAILTTAVVYVQNIWKRKLSFKIEVIS